MAKKIKSKLFLSLTCEVHHCHFDTALSLWNLDFYQYTLVFLHLNIIDTAILYGIVYACRDCHQGAREKRGATTLIFFFSIENPKQLRLQTTTSPPPLSHSPSFPSPPPPKLNPEEAQRYAVDKSSQYQNIISLSLTTYGIHTRFLIRM